MNKETNIDSTDKLLNNFDNEDTFKEESEFCECINAIPSIYPDGKWRCNYCFKIWYK